MDPHLDTRAFATLAESLQATSTTSETAEEVVEYAQRELDADFAGITMIRPRRRLETLAPSHELVTRVDALQYDLDEGPCRDSTWQGQTLTCQDLRAEPRWPRWAPKVVALGITSVLSVELTNSHGIGHRLGSVNLYFDHPRLFTSDDVAFAHVFARHAAVALAASEENAGLHTALDGRKRIGQAQGILMERHGLDEDQAFAVLRRYSQDNNVKLRDVAEQLVATRALPSEE